MVDLEDWSSECSCTAAVLLGPPFRVSSAHHVERVKESLTMEDLSSLKPTITGMLSGGAGDVLEQLKEVFETLGAFPSKWTTDDTI